MGTKDDKRPWTSIFKLAGEDRKNPHSITDCGEQQGKDLPSSDKEESHRRVGGHSTEMEALYNLPHNKL